MYGKQNAKRISAVLLSSAVLVASFTGTGAIIGTAAEPLSTDYGLMDEIQDGTILHCFDWTYEDIREELPNIAAAGFTSVQTSPAQPGGVTGAWWWLYQPLSFSIGNGGSNTLGTKAELQALCEEAHTYGVKVIVDVVANHLAGDHTNIQEDLKPSKYWRVQQNWGTSRKQVTHGDLGMGDIVSEDSYVQSVVAAYVQELKSVGVDGIRWDTTKHIQLPSEDCEFWNAVLDDEMYNYGEILGDPGAGNETDNRLPRKLKFLIKIDDGTNEI